MSGKTQRRTSNSVNPNDSVAGCILAYSEERPKTPDEVKPFRALSRNEPGTVFVHRGLVESEIPRDERFGLATNVPRGMQSDGLKELLSGPDAGTGLRGFTEDVRESVYKSHKTKPLGHSSLSGTQLPDKVLQPDFRHGIVTVESESSKTVIFSGSETAKQAESPNSYDDPAHARKFEAEVTQPLDRHYDWAAARIDPNTHRFGITHTEDSSTDFRISNALPSAVSEHQSQLIASRQVEAEELAHRAGGRRSAELLSTLPKDYAFGSKPVESNDWDAKKCMHGAYNEEDQQPDKDLGKSRLSLKSQQFMPTQAGSGTFGVKTIRNDKASPTLRSIADTTNYGDEPGVKSLVQLSSAAETDFSKARSASEVRVIFESSGHKLSDQEFDQMAAQAVSESGVLSVQSFRAVYNKVKLGINRS